MNDWFEWNGERCTTWGVHVLEQPPITFPAERAEFTDVLGRSGSLTMLEGEDVYDDITLTATCYIADPTKIIDLGGKLKGDGKVTFANRPGGFYYGRVVNQIPFEKIVRGRSPCTFELNFRCKPFWYKSGVSDLTFSASSNSLTNPGTVFSEPKITVHGSGDFSITVGGGMMLCTDITNGIILDTELQDALDLDGAQLLNNHVSGDFVTIRPGANTLAWLPFEGNDKTGTVTEIVVSPRWRYL